MSVHIERASTEVVPREAPANERRDREPTPPWQREAAIVAALARDACRARRTRAEGFDD